MDLTAIISCKNRNRNFEYCISSIYGCTPRPHIVVVDFGSETPLVIPEFIKAKEHIQLIHVKNNTDFFHKARALNIGIRSVKTKFMCITDVDQIFHNNFFGIVFNELKNNPKAFVMCKTFFSKTIPDWFTPLEVHSSYKKMMAHAKSFNMKKHGDGNCNGLLTEVALKLGGYDEQYRGYAAEDSDFAFRSFYYGLKRVSIDAKTNMIHLPHPRAGTYYSKDLVLKNKELFKDKFFINKTTKKKNIDVNSLIVNVGKSWGSL